MPVWIQPLRSEWQHSVKSSAFCHGHCGQLLFWAPRQVEDDGWASILLFCMYEPRENSLWLWNLLTRSKFSMLHHLHTIKTWVLCEYKTHPYQDRLQFLSLPLLLPICISSAILNEGHMNPLFFYSSVHVVSLFDRRPWSLKRAPKRAVVGGWMEGRKSWEWL